MSFIVDDEVLKKHNLTLEEFLVLYLNYKNFNICELNNSLFNKTIAFKDITDNTRLVLSNASKNIISEILNNSSPKIKEIPGRFDKLAEDLMALYPEGKKAGTTYYWRDNVHVISERLKKLANKPNVYFTNEEAIDATKRFVASFNGNYRYMPILRYFIWKKKNGGDDFDSQLLSYIENKGESTDDYDWTAELR